MPDFPPPPVLELEGNYTTWIHKWTHDPPTTYRSTVFIASDAGMVIFPYAISSGDNRIRLINLQDGSVISDTNIPELWDTYPVYDADTQMIFQRIGSQNWVGSILGKYMVTRKADATKWTSFFVWKDGVEIARVDMPAGTEPTDYFLMSYNGKYIIIEDGISNRKLVCFEGD